MANAVTDDGHEVGGGNAGGSGSGSARRPRLPKWTRHEILVMIQGKKVAESQGRGRAQRTGYGALPGRPVEPKWAAVSSYCRRRGVNRGPLQCQKRWGNLASGYNKIKGWEGRRRSGDGGEVESFWAMRGEQRRERGLPASFDREVYDVLDGAAEPEPKPEEEEDEGEPGRGGGAPPPSEALFDSGRTAAEDGLFSDFEQDQDEEEEEEEEDEEEDERTAAAPTLATPVSERKFQPDSYGPSESGLANGEQPAHNMKESSSREAHKRKRPLSGDAGESHLQNQFLEILDRNSRALAAHLEAQNVNWQLERDQRKDHADRLVGVLSKLADALGRIADKL